MKSYREVLGKVEGLQRGFTSGTCAQAAAKGAMLMLLSKKKENEVLVKLKGGMELTIPLIGQIFSEKSVSCGVIKDSGDDSDISHGKEFRAEVQWIDTPGISILGGKGVGTVTLPGLPVAPGEAAINPNPLRMINRELEPLLPAGKGVSVTISVPEGEILAKETWNPRLGITGGISIIGTSGIIEPKSSKAYKASIALCMNVLKKSGSQSVYITPGYVGEAYLKKTKDLSDEEIIKVGDHVGFALDTARLKGFKKIVFVGHIGKMAKIASGIFNTHCKYGDARLETIAAYAGAGGASQDDIIKLLEMTMAEASVAFLKERNLMITFDLLNKKIIERSLLRLKKNIPLTSIILDLKGQVLSELNFE
ncbi:MAG: cobalt-precorrin-5B (C(1))-methyltransferase CbiD [Spirochaetaceae bacterium]|jgi:cobalt-precorrin-5B (C1)-methyltransferase|nr:cobalt-precorrin-5B (C(1))-methyltransferase CbiD [Spirochaetaceae bacterium]